MNRANRGEAAVFEHLQGQTPFAFFDQLATDAAMRAARRRAFGADQP
jgi:hypothetical protein